MTARGLFAMVASLTVAAPGAARALGLSAQGALGVGQLVSGVDSDAGTTYGLILGLHFTGPLGLELEYQHGDNDAKGVLGHPTVSQDGALGHVRFDLLRRSIVPFVYGGVGVMHYSASSVSTDDWVVFPVGGGVEVQLGLFEFGARGEYQYIPSDVADRSADFWKLIGTVGVRLH